jgi:hypothetical protein
MQAGPERLLLAALKPALLLQRHREVPGMHAQPQVHWPRAVHFVLEQVGGEGVGKAIGDGLHAEQHSAAQQRMWMRGVEVQCSKRTLSGVQSTQQEMINPCKGRGSS